MKLVSCRKIDLIILRNMFICKRKLLKIKGNKRLLHRILLLL